MSFNSHRPNQLNVPEMKYILNYQATHHQVRPRVSNIVKCSLAAKDVTAVAIRVPPRILPIVVHPYGDLETAGTRTNHTAPVRRQLGTAVARGVAEHVGGGCHMAGQGVVVRQIRGGGGAGDDGRLL